MTPPCKGGEGDDPLFPAVVLLAPNCPLAFPTLVGSAPLLKQRSLPAPPSPSSYINLW